MYSCWRDQSHWGKDPTFLIQRLLTLTLPSKELRYSRVRAVRLLEDYEMDGPAPTAAQPQPVAQNGEWERFLPAYDSERHMEYLKSRGFRNPIHVARTFDLRYARVGKWAQRLLFPLYDMDGSVASWTGRAIKQRIEPPYLTLEVEASPRLLGGKACNQTQIIVEGPMDSAKINAGLMNNLRRIAAASLNGKVITAGKLRFIKSIAPKQILLCLDADATLAANQRMLLALQRTCTKSIVRRIAVPEQFNDPGSMPENAIVDWLSEESLRNDLKMGGSD